MEMSANGTITRTLVYEQLPVAPQIPNYITDAIRDTLVPFKTEGGGWNIKAIAAGAAIAVGIIIVLKRR